MVARSFHQRAGVAAEYFIRKICIFLRVIVIRREEEQKRQEKVESERARRGGRLKQNQLFIRIGREKVLIIRGKYKLNTRREKCTRLPRPLLPLPLLLCRRSLSLSLSRFRSREPSVASVSTWALWQPGLQASFLP